MVIYQYFAILQGDKIAAITRAYPPQKLKKNQIPLTWDEFYFLEMIKSDIAGAKIRIRMIEKKIKGVQDVKSKRSTK